MQIIITGGGGFLGQRLAQAILTSPLHFDDLLLVDIVQPANPGQDKRVRCQQAVQQMLDSLRNMTDDETLARVRLEPNQAINRIVSSWPGAIDTTRALQMGFLVDHSFDECIRQYMTTTSKGSHE